MADPSKRRASDAVCRLVADAFIEWANIAEPPEGPNRVRCWVEMVQPALTAYRRETAPLRSKAEVDAERLLNLDAWRRRVVDDSTLRFRDERLCREETAPEAEPDQCEDCMLLKHEEPTVCERNMLGAVLCNSCAAARVRAKKAVAEPNALTDHDADTREERPCGCEESEALKAQLDRCRAIVRALRRGEVSGEAAARALERELGR